MVVWSCFLLLTFLGMYVIIKEDSFKSVMIDYYATILQAFRDATIWSKSAVVRIWDEVPTFTLVTEQMISFLAILDKIDAAIWSLFQWDEVDDAIVDWTKQTIVYVGKGILDITREVITIISTSALMEHLARSILQTIIDAPCSNQALALLDLVQDAEP